jgi:hypothetical protein
MSYIYKQMAMHLYKQMMLHQYRLMLHTTQIHQFYQLFTITPWAVIGPLRGSFSRNEQSSRECFGASLRGARHIGPSESPRQIESPAKFGTQKTMNR